ncbi:MAG: DUF2064 domain-containing protein [Nocardioides sp.]
MTTPVTIATGARALVVAKAPVAGRVKTRLGADVGHAAAADLAAAALLDTIAACAEAFGADGCLIALSGDLADAVRGDEIARAIEGWSIARQRGSTFAERLANAHADVPPGGPVVQVGMDTPQLTATALHDAARGLDAHDAVLGPAEDGGWWVLGLCSPAGAAALHDVEMSTPTTYADTCSALALSGLDVGTTGVLRDVDTVADAEVVAREAPESRFAQAWRELAR